MTRLRDIHGPGHSQADYLRALAAGHETGWWDERGIPAPWPDDFLDPNSGWRLNRPGVSGDSEPWEGWSHVREHTQAVSG